MKELTPEILEQVAQIGDSYVHFLYFKHLTEVGMVTSLLGVTGYAVYRIMKKEGIFK